MLSGVLHLPALFMASLSLRELYFQWESSGVFDFFLPALLIFAVVFGILGSTKILGNNRGVSMIIALAISIIAIRTPFVSSFFTTVFPNFGIALAVVVIIVILMGLFVNPGNLAEFSNTLMYGALGVGIIVAVVTFNQYDWFGSYWWQENWVTVLFVVIFVIILSFFFADPKSKEEKEALSKGFVHPVKALRE